AVDEIQKLPGVITAFPGGVVGSGSKVGSKYSFLTASTNEAYCPTLKGQVNSALSDDVGSVLEIVSDGLDEASINEAMRIGIKAACSFGSAKGICSISAGNYGGNLGPYLFPLRKILK
ncbi:MAG: formylmethanofuran--tetrahydromethanopterin N-formyltransferase, partial [Gammaproteobacteria bacterium]